MSILNGNHLNLNEFINLNLNEFINLTQILYLNSKLGANLSKFPSLNITQIDSSFK
jgi:hypothetical protein